MPETMQRVWMEIGPKSVERLQEIKRVILEEPRRFFMEGFYNDGNVQTPTWFQEPPCGTAACLCGWANILRMKEAGFSLEDKKIMENAASNKIAALKWLDIEDNWNMENGTRFSDLLFFSYYWPLQYKTQYRLAGSPQAAAQAAADYIDYLCTQPVRSKTDGD